MNIQEKNRVDMRNRFRRAIEENVTQREAIIFTQQKQIPGIYFSDPE